MPRSTKRADEDALNTLHRLTTKALIAEIRRLGRAKEPVPPSLLTASIKMLSITGSTTPARPARRADRLKDVLDDFVAAEAGAEPPKTGKGSRGPREIDFSEGAQYGEFPEED